MAAVRDCFLHFHYHYDEDDEVESGDDDDCYLICHCVLDLKFITKIRKMLQQEGRMIRKTYPIYLNPKVQKKSLPNRGVIVHRHHKQF